MLLLITAGLLARGLVRSRVADPGFDTRGLHLLTADFGSDPARALARQRRLLERLRTSPGFSGVSVGGVPMLGTWTPPMVADQEFAAEPWPATRVKAICRRWESRWFVGVISPGRRWRRVRP